MSATLQQVRARVEAQRDLVPGLYDAFDFSQVPHRFTTDPEVPSTLPPQLLDQREAILGNEDAVEILRWYTMLGDVWSDAYAALMPTYGFHRLVAMLVQACDDGIEAVEDAPDELVALVRELERVPDWVDLDLVERGAFLERNVTAHVAPYVTRGAFLATFLNEYSALPMALTGTLSNDSAGRRVKETATFFATSVLPGALRRDGPGFKSAAMVRLMHSMVRVNLLTKPGMWDPTTHGMVIPQVDQMPAGMIGIFLLASDVLKDGRTEFDADERAMVEIARYRCHLLGLPEDLLPSTPREIIDILLARAATLRDGFDDETCGALIRATLAAYLPAGDSLAERTGSQFEQSFAKVFFLKTFLAGDGERAAEIGVPVTVADNVRAAALAASIAVRFGAFKLALKVPATRDRADRLLVAKVERQLRSYGHAEFTTDAAKYRGPVGASV